MFMWIWTEVWYGTYCCPPGTPHHRTHLRHSQAEACFDFSENQSRSGLIQSLHSHLKRKMVFQQIQQWTEVQIIPFYTNATTFKHLNINYMTWHDILYPSQYIVIFNVVESQFKKLVPVITCITLSQLVSIIVSHVKTKKQLVREKLQKPYTCLSQRHLFIKLKLCGAYFTLQGPYKFL